MVNAALEERLVLVAESETHSYLERVLALENQVLARVVKRLLLCFLHRCNRLILRERAIDRVRGLEINLIVAGKVFKVAAS